MLWISPKILLSLAFSLIHTWEPNRRRYKCMHFTYMGFIDGRLRINCVFLNCRQKRKKKLFLFGDWEKKGKKRHSMWNMVVMVVMRLVFYIKHIHRMRFGAKIARHSSNWFAASLLNDYSWKLSMCPPLFNASNLKITCQVALRPPKQVDESNMAAKCKSK